MFNQAQLRMMSRALIAGKRGTKVARRCYSLRVAPGVPTVGNPNVVRFIASTGARDRHFTRLIPEGMQAQGFLANPVFMWNHRSGDVCEPDDVLGRVVRLVVEEVAGRRVVVADVEFVVVDAEGKPRKRAADCLAAVRAGLLNAVSVGFLPLRIEPGDDADLILEWELVELSLVPVPSNAEALAIRALRSTTKRGSRMDAEMLKKLGLAEGADADTTLKALYKYLGETSDSPEDRQKVIAAVQAYLDTLTDSSASGDENSRETPDEEMVKALERTAEKIGEIEQRLEKRIAELEKRSGQSPTPAPTQPSTETQPKSLGDRLSRLFKGGNPAGSTASPSSQVTVSKHEQQARAIAERAARRKFTDQEWASARAKFVK